MNSKRKAKATSKRKAKIAKVKIAAKMKAKAKMKMKAKPQLKAKKVARTTAAIAKSTPPPVSISRGKKGKVQYDKQVFVRFDTAEVKEMVRTAAGPNSLSAYIAAAAVKAAQDGKTMEDLKPMPAAPPEQVAG